jgi:hypothetical protein
MNSIKTMAFATAFASSLLGFYAPALAADEYGIANEKVVQIDVTVVDIVCTLTGNCPANCGGGKRQLGLMTTDSKLRLPVKGQTLFANAIPDLLPYCGKSVQIDGLLIENPAMTIVHVQNMRESADQKWKPTEAFEAQWIAKNGKAEEWQRADPLVKDVIAANGVFGIKGLEPKK